MAVRSPSPVVDRSRKMMWPDCSPPSTASSRSIASKTWRSPTGVRTIRPPACRDGALEAAVAHHGRHEQVVAERPVRQPLERADAHHRVTVDEPAPLVDGDEAVGVTVEREAEVEAGGGHRLGQALRMGRTAAVVDVHAVRARRRGPSPRRRGERNRSGATALAEPLAQSIPMRSPRSASPAISAR